MPPFPKPTFNYNYVLNVQLQRLRQHKTARQIPGKTPGTRLILTWNIANLAQQERTDNDWSIIADAMSWFDVIAVQERKENLAICSTSFTSSDRSMSSSRKVRTVRSCPVRRDFSSARRIR